jgi:opacity protein-like surface antigen
MLKKIAAAVVLSTLAASSFAAPGFYAGVDAGRTQMHSDSDVNSLGAFVGYRFNDYLGAELGYRELGQWGAGTGFDYKAEQTAFSAVGTLPLSKGFNVFGRLGVNNIHVNSDFGAINRSNTDLKLLYGLGVGYSFSPNISARVEVQKPWAALTNIGASFIYSF